MKKKNDKTIKIKLKGNNFFFKKSNDFEDMILPTKNTLLLVFPIENISLRQEHSSPLVSESRVGSTRVIDKRTKNRNPGV